MNRAFIYFLLIILTNAVTAQELNYIGNFGKFSSANSFSINPAGIIFAADNEKNEIYKIDTLGITLKSIGGYGWGESAFDDPADIFATTLNIYVTDKNNHRIQIFDKDLNYLSQFKTNESENEDLQFAYPACAAVSNQGDLYILDSDNTRILKYGLSGNFLLQIGGNDAGEYSLSNPINFAISDDGKLFVIDSDKIFVFDQYGTGLAKIEIGIEAYNLAIGRNKILFNNIDIIKIVDLNNLHDGFKIFDSAQLEINSPIKEAILFNNKLYVLTSSEIHVYNFAN